MPQTDNGQSSVNAPDLLVSPNNVYSIPQNRRDMLVFFSLVFALESEANVALIRLYCHRVPYTKRPRSN
jgi:hypothetical protein